MDSQTLFNIAAALVGAFGGYILNRISDNLKSLQIADTVLTEKVQKIEVLVAGEYVKHTDLEKFEARLFDKLDKMDTKLDTKVDKP